MPPSSSRPKTKSLLLLWGSFDFSSFVFSAFEGPSLVAVGLCSSDLLSSSEILLINFLFVLLFLIEKIRGGSGGRHSVR